MMSKKHDRSTIGAVGIMIGGASLHLSQPFSLLSMCSLSLKEEVSDIWSYG